MDIISFIQTAQYNLPLYLGGFLLYIAIIWLAVVVWVWTDIKSRTYSIVAQLAAVLLTLGGNLPGLVIYLLLRPQHTLEEHESNSLFHASILDKSINACPSCNFLVRDDFKHCPNCQETLLVTCDRCDARVNPTWKYCVGCGKRQYPETEQEKLGRRIRKSILWIFNIPSNTFTTSKKVWNRYISFVNKNIVAKWQDAAKQRKLKEEEKRKAQAEKKQAENLAKQEKAKQQKEAKSKKSNKKGKKSKKNSK